MNSAVPEVRGIDTQARIPVLALMAELLIFFFAPVISVPDLKFSPWEGTFGLWKLADLADALNWQYGDFVERSMAEAIRQPLLIGMVLFLAGVILFLNAYRLRKLSGSSVLLGRILFGVMGCLGIGVFALVTWLNLKLNQFLAIENTLMTLTRDSKIQVTAWTCLLLVAAWIMIPTLSGMMNLHKDYDPEAFITRSGRDRTGMSGRTMASMVLVVTAIPLVILFGIFILNDRSDYFISLCVIVLSMMPFFISFENRRPQAREIVVIAVMAALAVTGRAAFVMVPFFKPVSAIVIVTGIALGGEAGFLTGALAAFVSNFLFGQGPWTPWQMFSFGMIGFLAGVLFRSAAKKRNHKGFMPALCIYGFLSVLGIYGVLMDTCTVMTGTGSWNKGAFLAAYASGLPVNLVHAGSTVIFLLVLGKPILDKLDRIKKKYGLMEP